VTEAPVVREPEEPAGDDEPLVIRPADQAGAEDDPDADQGLDAAVPDEAGPDGAGEPL
jgi:hypothetical protein